MYTISKKKFMSDFIGISNKLTKSEIQFLYLLVTHPDLHNKTQGELADILDVNRRTIVIGMKKLKQYGFVSDNNITRQSGHSVNLMRRSDEENDSHDEITKQKKPFDFLEVIKCNTPSELKKFFDDYPDDRVEILWEFRFSLNMKYERLAATYGLTDEFKKIMLAERYKKDLAANKPDEFWDYNSIERRYMSRIQKGHIKKAKEILKQMILIFPELKDRIVRYREIYGFEGFDEYVKETFEENFDKKLWGEP